MDAATILKRRDAAKAERQKYEPMFDDAIRLTMPGRKRFHDVNVQDSDDIFDETGANAVVEFTSRMQAGLFPPFSEFVKLEASSLVSSADRRAVNKDLDDICKYAFEEIWSSNFAQESSESLNDLAISTGTLLVEEGTGSKRLHHRAIPITELYLELGPDETIAGQFRVSEVLASNLEARYPQAKMKDAERTKDAIAKEQNKKLTVVEYTRSFSDRRGERCEHYVVVEDFKEIVHQRKMSGLGCNPFTSFRWATAAGETWGRGPLMNALAAIRTTNLMVELVLENAAMSIVGIYQTDNDGIMNADTINLLPGTILPKEIGSRGLEQINAAAGNFSMRDVVLNDQRINIKRALFNDMLADPGKTPATAYEVAERTADLAYRTSAGFSRIFYEFVIPYMRRVLYILQKRRDIELPVKNGRAISFHAVSPLAQAQEGRKLQGLFQDFQMRAGIYGPEKAELFYDMKELNPWFIEKSGLPEKLYRKTADVQKAFEQISQAMAEQQNPAPAPQPMMGKPRV